MVFLEEQTGAGGEDQMPTETFLVIVGVVGAFVAFGVILAFADIYTTAKRGS